jgi:hypothetical protein
MCGRFVRFSSWADLRRTMTLLSPSENASPRGADVLGRHENWAVLKSASPMFETSLVEDGEGEVFAYTLNGQ